MRSRFPPRLTATLGAVAVIAAAAQAQAHAHLVSASPAANATVPPPKTLVLHFSERLEPKFSGVEVFKADASRVPVSSEVPADDRKTILGKVTGPLSPGVYQVKWHDVAADGHHMEGTYSFSVR